MLNLRSFSEKVILSLTDRDEHSIIEVRQQSQFMGAVAWRIECACDAELYARAQSAKPNRGTKDIDSIGVQAQVAKRAREVGCTPLTIYRNARVHKLLEECKATIADERVFLLDQKGYFTAAIDTTDAIAAVKMFIAEKEKEPRFRVSDAFRLIDAQGITKVAFNKRALEAARSGEPNNSSGSLLDHINRTINQIEQTIIPDCPDASFAKRMYGSFLQDLTDHCEMIADEDTASALKRAWDEGYKREDQMSLHTGFDAETVSRIMQYLCEEGEFVKVRQDKDQVSGRYRTLWDRVVEPVRKNLPSSMDYDDESGDEI